MKKLLFSAIAMIAFAGTASAQKIDTKAFQDAIDCTNKATEYVKDHPDGKIKDEALRAYYSGCIDAKNESRNLTKNLNIQEGIVH